LRPRSRPSHGISCEGRPREWNTAVRWNASTTHSVVKYGAITQTLRPGQQTILEIALENPGALFHVRQVFAIELGSAFEIQAVLFDGQSQLGDAVLRTDLLRFGRRFSQREVSFEPAGQRLLGARGDVFARIGERLASGALRKLR
jgi:hypothetical protein